MLQAESLPVEPPRKPRYAINLFQLLKTRHLSRPFLYTLLSMGFIFATFPKMGLDILKKKKISLITENILNTKGQQAGMMKYILTHLRQEEKK